MNTQLEQIKAALMEGLTLTPLSALEKFRCFRLAARVSDLKRRGMSIETIRLESNGKHYAGYRLAKLQLELV